MKNVKVSRCLLALLVISVSLPAWSDETAPESTPMDMGAPADAAAPPPTTDVSNEGVPPAPAADPGLGSPEEAPAEAPAKPKKKHAKKKAAKKKASKKKSAKKSKKKKSGHDKKKKKKKKAHHESY